MALDKFGHALDEGRTDRAGVAVDVEVLVEETLFVRVEHHAVRDRLEGLGHVAPVVLRLSQDDSERTLRRDTEEGTADGERDEQLKGEG
jgi:hypothetical protein